MRVSKYAAEQSRCTQASPGTTIIKKENTYQLKFINEQLRGLIALVPHPKFMNGFGPAFYPVEQSLLITEAAFNYAKPWNFNLTNNS